MTKTWETLFNLSNFMKFLLVEVLPDERVSSPSYVLHSLYELLSVTNSCIDQIITNKKNYLVEPAAEEGKSSKLCKENEEKILLQNCVSDCSGLSTVTKDLICKEELVKDDTNTKLESEIRIGPNIPVKFIVLSDQMHNGRLVGHYCRPCDFVVSSKELWEKHLSYKIHYENDDNENKDVPCDYCNLIIFASGGDSEVLLNYHLEKHFASVNTGCTIDGITEEDVKCTDDSLNESKNDYDMNSEKSRKFNNNTIEETFSNSKDSLEENNNSFKSIINDDKTFNGYFIVKKFQNFNSMIHLCNFQDGFYCRPCNAAFRNKEEWLTHILDDKHLRFVENAKKKLKCWEGKCAYCSLTILAAKPLLKVYMEFHTVGHKQPLSYTEKIINTKQNKNLKLELECRSTPVLSCTSSLNDETGNVSDNLVIYQQNEGLINLKGDNNKHFQIPTSVICDWASTDDIPEEKKKLIEYEGKLDTTLEFTCKRKEKQRKVKKNKLIPSPLTMSREVINTENSVEVNQTENFLVPIKNGNKQQYQISSVKSSEIDLEVDNKHFQNQTSGVSENKIRYEGDVGTENICKPMPLPRQSNTKVKYGPPMTVSHKVINAENSVEVNKIECIPVSIINENKQQHPISFVKSSEIVLEGDDNKHFQNQTSAICEDIKIRVEGELDSTNTIKPKVKRTNKSKKTKLLNLSPLTASQEVINTEKPVELNQTENIPVSIKNDDKQHCQIRSVKSIENCSNDWADGAEDYQDTMFLQLINSRTEQKQKTQEPNFGGLCLVCKVSFDSAFDWGDHLNDVKHTQNSSSKDASATVNELNINLFGDINILKKYGNLIKYKIIVKNYN